MGKSKLYPLFDKDRDPVGWIDRDAYIFDTSLNWVAFISNNHAWSAQAAHWLGPVKGLLCMDAIGKPVAWNPTEEVWCILPPERPERAVKVEPPSTPARPAIPKRPAKPANPTRGWSILSFSQWLAQ